MPRVTRRASFVLLANAMLRAAGTLVFIAVGRIKGPDDAGVLALSLGYLAILTTLFLGLDDLLIKEVTAKPEGVVKIVLAYAVLRLPLTVLACLTVLALSQTASHITPSQALVMRLIVVSAIFDGFAGLGHAVLYAFGGFQQLLYAAAADPAAARRRGDFAAGDQRIRCCGGHVADQRPGRRRHRAVERRADHPQGGDSADPDALGVAAHPPPGWADAQLRGGESVGGFGVPTRHHSAFGYAVAAGSGPVCGRLHGDEHRGVDPAGVPHGLVPGPHPSAQRSSAEAACADRAGCPKHGRAGES